MRSDGTPKIIHKCIHVASFSGFPLAGSSPILGNDATFGHVVAKRWCRGCESSIDCDAPTEQ
jgi:hypothetical protein